MEEKLHDIRQTFQKFKAAYATNSFDTCSNLLSQLKVMILIFVLVLIFTITPRLSDIFSS
jgi:26S proteasome regulatory subunit N12